MPCIPAPAGGAAAFFWQPAIAIPTITRQISPELRLNVLFLTESFLCARSFYVESPV
jgi:hypothetical protein